MELWQQCSNWLREVTLLDSSVQFQRVEEFAAFLKDGFALCALANKLSDGSASQVRRKYNTGTSQFISESNLSLFLNACRSTFGIAEKDLFRVEDLSDLIDFSKVLKVLSLLSRSKHAETLGISPFPYGAPRRTSSQHFLTDEEMETYTELCTHTEAASSPYDPNGDIYGPNNNEEEIYNSFVYQKINKTTLSKYADFKPRNKKEFCLKELLDTETNYCGTLKMIIEHFYNPMGMIVEPDRHRAIFINIDELQRFHVTFLERIRESILVYFGLNKDEDNDSVMRLPEVFIVSKFDFLIYTEYCSYLEASRIEIAQIEKVNPDVNRQVEQFNVESIPILDLQAVKSTSMTHRRIWQRPFDFPMLAH